MKALNLKFVRNFSTPAPLTPEQIEVGVANVKNYKNFSKATMSPILGVVEGRAAAKDLTLPENISEVAALSGMPAEHAKRTVVIAPRLLKSQQVGNKYSHLWELSWKNGDRWTNPLMGWTSGADPQHAVRLTFNTPEDAIFFAKKNGWKYEVSSPTADRTVPLGINTYADNFLPRPIVQQLKEQGLKNKIFVNPGYGKSNWFMPLKYHGDGEVVQFGVAQKK